MVTLVPKWLSTDMVNYRYGFTSSKHTMVHTHIQIHIQAHTSTYQQTIGPGRLHIWLLVRRVQVQFTGHQEHI